MTTPYTDIIVGILLLFAFYTGWRKGLFRMILGPLALLFCTFFGALNYDVNQNLFQSLLIITVGTFLLTIVARTILFITRRTIDKAYRDKSFTISRLLGGLVSLVWKGSFLCLAILTIMSLPFTFGRLKDVKADISRSATMAFINGYLLGKFPPIQTVLKTADLLHQPNINIGIASSSEYKAFTNDPQVRAVMSDPQVHEALEKKEFIPLLTNPKVRKLLKNEETMRNLSKLTRKIYEENTKKTAEKNSP